MSVLAPSAPSLQVFFCSFLCPGLPRERASKSGVNTFPCSLRSCLKKEKSSLTGNLKEKRLYGCMRRGRRAIYSCCYTASPRKMKKLLRELNLGFNFLNAKNDLFKNLKNLTFLDVSRNSLSSTKLGSQQQLENLQELVMSQNQITELKKEDLYFLRNSSLKRLDLSSNPIKKFQPGCFHAIGNIYGLDLNNIPLGHDGTEKLCLELSGTKIQNLSMSKVQLSWISNLTFSGMKERDFEAGISEFEAIINSIQRSRKIIFIVTKHLLKDPWCKR
ncbi:toll-like receptor 3 [Crotalus adamanteus]|uniref:Toll-like receptor 3 n=1 Tax=Crotalus adamanteus TaxID=8729 RepID=A0AAW1BB09_CROAD